MDDSLTEPKVAARRWTFRIPAYILLPFYLMLIGVALLLTWVIVSGGLL